MKITRPVVTEVLVCDACKSDIRGFERRYTLKVHPPEDTGFYCEFPDLDICQDCFKKLGTDFKQKEIVGFASSASYAITGSFALKSWDSIGISSRNP